MKRNVLAAAVSLVLACAAVSPAVAEPKTFYEGLQMYNQGRYEAAAVLWFPLADREDANAQSGLGYLFYKGLGVARDSVVAAKWFRRAAERGVVQAQLFLSMMYYDGDGVPQSAIFSYMWSDLAMSAGYAPAIAMRELTSRSMTAADIEQAQRLAVEWRDAHDEN